MEKSIIKLGIDITNENFHEKHEMSNVIDNSLVIFKEEAGLYIYGESLSEWLSIGASISGDIQISLERGKVFFYAKISPTFFFTFIVDRPNIFKVDNLGHAYKIKIKIKWIT
ncbi:Uncharacterised protein [Aeromonas salmonicida]|uniref:hypothetical protein n=1 Tax=Aeromonas salmonicida TaxID=645 RepID=UPI0010269075|nr:hypothetical protein [Aeromonas salmonicida]VFB09618.1 Uncharacterised protein [Aeromonas salmonicida]